MSLIPRVIVRRWLEAMLALVSLAILYFTRRPDTLPRALDLSSDAGLTLWDWIFRGMAFGLLGVWGFSALVVGFFLLYSPIYVINKVPHLVGKGGWLDRREVRFYLACFALRVPARHPDDAVLRRGGGGVRAPRRLRPDDLAPPGVAPRVDRPRRADYPCRGIWMKSRCWC